MPRYFFDVHDGGHLPRQARAVTDPDEPAGHVSLDQPERHGNSEGRDQGPHGGGNHSRSTAGQTEAGGATIAGRRLGALGSRGQHQPGEGLERPNRAAADDALNGAVEEVPSRRGFVLPLAAFYNGKLH